MSTSSEVNSSSKRSSLSSRASKIPQKIAQSTFFTLRPSSSTLTTGTAPASNDRISTRLSQMFRARTTSEVTFKDTSIQEIDNRIQHLPLSRSPNFCQSANIDIRPHKGQQAKSGSKSDHLSQLYNRTDSHSITYSQSDISSSSPYSTSSPERTDLYSYYYNIAPKNESSAAGFSPLSFTNSSISLAESFFNSQLTLSSPPMPSVDANTPSFERLVANTVEELAAAIVDYTSYLLNLFNSTNDFAFTHLRELNSIGTEKLPILVEACNEPSYSQEILKLRNQLRDIQTMVHSNNYQIIPSFDVKTQGSYIKLLIADIQHICKECLKLSESFPSLSSQLTEDFKKELPKFGTTQLSASDYKGLVPDQVDQKAIWFRHHFVGKPYFTLIGSFKQEKPVSAEHTERVANKKKRHSISKNRNSKTIMGAFLHNNHDLAALSTNQAMEQAVGIISIIQERARVNGLNRNGNIIFPQTGVQYRIIIRNSKPDQKRFVVQEAMARETLAQLELRGEASKVDKVLSHHDNRLRAFITKNSSSQSENNIQSRLLRAAILTVCPNLDLHSFKELSAETTILAGLEKDLLKYDEIQIPKRYKFGMITIQSGQNKEEAWFSNTGLSTEFREFMNILGTKIELIGYTGYAAGLDTKTGETGKYSYVSKWNDLDIMFHVAPLMPFSKTDKQQVMRKRFIGNDISCVVFIEGDGSFNPDVIRSQFLHVYILVRTEHMNGNRYWRVEVLRNSKVCDFGPPLPSPPLFYDADALKEFLTLKHIFDAVVNAESAALKSDKFRIPNARARVGLLETHVQTGLSFHQPQIIRSASTNRLVVNRSSSTVPPKDIKKMQRPRSVNDKASSRGLSNGGSSRLLQEAILDEEKRKMSTGANEDVPPVPTISRSTLLQDLKKGITSSSKKLKEATTTHDYLVHRRQSHLNASDKSTHAKSVNTMKENNSERVRAREDSNTRAIKRESKDGTNKVPDEPVQKDRSRTSIRPRPSASARPPQLLLNVASKSSNVANLKSNHSTVMSWR